IVRQLRLRDIGGIIVVDFIDMVLESNRDLVLRRLVECLSRDRTKHQVAEVTSLGLVQMTRKKLGLGLLESFSETCEVCAGRGLIVHHDPVFKHRGQQAEQPAASGRGRRGRGGNGGGNGSPAAQPAPKAGNGTHEITDDVRNALAKIAAKTVHHEEHAEPSAEQVAVAVAAAPVEILDIPIEPVRGEQPRAAVDPDAVLGQVLDALPEPKKPGQGRSRRSRRASSAAGSPDAQSAG
ncbi:MAG: ribonuclease E/G, partial [Protaetiibacter sp.]